MTSNEIGIDRINAIIAAAKPIEPPEISAERSAPRRRTDKRRAKKKPHDDGAAGDLAASLRDFCALINRSPEKKKRAAFEVAVRHIAARGGDDFVRLRAVDGLFELAISTGIVREHGVDAVQEVLAAAFGPMQNKPEIHPRSDDDGDGGDVERAPEFSDEALALRFADVNSNHLKYVSAWGRWLIWAGVRWISDDTLAALNLARNICRHAAETCSEVRVSRAIASAKTVSAVEKLAKADRRIAATVGQFDAEIWLLNTPAGIVDLRTGTQRSSNPTDFLTKLTGVAPASSQPCPTWKQFLSRVTGDDADLIAFLQRVAGYSLTGSTEAHALFFLYGTGSNGKSTFINALIGCMGDYHRTAAIETFTASSSERHPTDMAGLRGARLVTAVETEEGRRWAESKVKALTGGDTIAARFMRQDYFEFVPTFKLLIAGNHKPGLRSVDEAIRRRFNLIPFTVTIPESERDEGLPDKLRAEWPSILGWMIQGCLDWQRRGLDPPSAVIDATAAYLEAEDALAAWIEEAGEVDPNFFEGSQALFGSWKQYATRTGEYVGSLKKFSQRLEERGASIGLSKSRGADGTRGFVGLRLHTLTPDLAAEPSTADDVVPF